MALGAMLAASKVGLGVPGDVSVRGYDDESELAAEAVPTLSTVHLPYEQAVRWAVARVVDGDTDAASGRCCRALVDRESVAAPRG